MEKLSFHLDPVPPFRLDLTAWLLRRRADNVIDRWDGKTYHRVLVVENEAIEVAVVQVSPARTALLEVEVTGARLPSGTRQVVSLAMDRALGIGIDLSEFYSLAETDQQLGKLVQPFRGVKPPRYPSLFETLANAITCQQITLSLGIRMLNKMAETYGLAFTGEAGPCFAFPRPADLALLPPEGLRPLGLTRAKSRSLVGLATGVVNHRIDLEALLGENDETARQVLTSWPGIGRWTAEYFLLRGAGRLDSFPGDDVGGRNHLQRWLGLADKLDYQRVEESLAAWKPYAGLIYLHLLLNGLVEDGLLVV
jgi:DNA-3-methyladenine glycosylase II